MANQVPNLMITMRLLDSLILCKCMSPECVVCKNGQIRRPCQLGIKVYIIQKRISPINILWAWSMLRIIRLVPLRFSIRFAVLHSARHAITTSGHIRNSTQAVSSSQACLSLDYLQEGLLDYFL